MSAIRISNITLNTFNRTQAHEKIARALCGAGPAQIVTLNALMLNFILRDAILAKAVNSAKIVLADSAGIALLAGIFSGQKIERVTGIDLISHFCAVSSEKGYSIFMFGAKPGVAEAAAENIRKSFPKANICGTRNGYFAKSEENRVIEEIRSARADILLVGLAVPDQEKWIAGNLEKFGAKIVIGVGGSFDVLSGRLSRAPRWMRKVGLEWLYRLAQEP